MNVQLNTLRRLTEPTDPCWTTVCQGMRASVSKRSCCSPGRQVGNIIEIRERDGGRKRSKRDRQNTIISAVEFIKILLRTLGSPLLYCTLEISQNKYHRTLYLDLWRYCVCDASDQIEMIPSSIQIDK